MSLRSWCLLLSLWIAACGADTSQHSDEPQTAKEKLRRQAEADGEVDTAGSRNWGKWRYSGDRSDCFFVVRARCFKTEKAACSAARCKAPKECRVDGAGPAQVSCQ
jgi:hypothetical protein